MQVDSSPVSDNVLPPGAPRMGVLQQPALVASAALQPVALQPMTAFALQGEPAPSPSNAERPPGKPQAAAAVSPELPRGDRVGVSPLGAILAYASQRSTPPLRVMSPLRFELSIAKK